MSEGIGAKFDCHDVSCPPRPEEVDMRYLLCLIVTFTLAVLALSQVPVTVIRAGALIDGKSDRPRRDQVIVIRGNRLESISDAANAKRPMGATILDLFGNRDSTVLIDSTTLCLLHGS